VHRRAADGRALALPAAAAGLAARDVLMVDVADLADGRAARERHAAHLAGRRRRTACGPSFATSWTPEPAERAIFAPWPGFSSTLCTSVPVGMFSSGSALPTLMSASGPDSTLAPTRSCAGARM